MQRGRDLLAELPREGDIGEMRGQRPFQVQSVGVANSDLN
jgi:hypothetical protein